jgi:hypothetical protein
MKGHRYRLNLEYLADAKGNPESRPPLQVTFSNHDDLYEIVDRIKAKGLFEPDEAASFAIGLKMFREVMLHHRGSEVFRELEPHMGAFMKSLKQL